MSPALLEFYLTVSVYYSVCLTSVVRQSDHWCPSVRASDLLTLHYQSQIGADTVNMSDQLTALQSYITLLNSGGLIGNH